MSGQPGTPTFVRVTGRAESDNEPRTFYLNLANVSTAVVDEQDGDLRITLVMLGMVSHQERFVGGQQIRVFGEDARTLDAALRHYARQI